MKKKDFKSVSNRLYAICTDKAKTSVLSRDDGTKYSYFEIPAVWYKKKSGQTYAAFGYLWSYLDGTLTIKQAVELDDPRDSFIANMTARYDGNNFWGIESLEEQNKIIKLLKPMLDRIPNLPNGYKGWYSLK